MNCEIDKTKLHLYFDNQLDEHEIRFVSQHIVNCKICKQEIDYLFKLKQQLSLMTTVSISPSLSSKLNRIGKSKGSFILLIQDIIKITFINRNETFHIDKAFEMILHEKYNKNIIRWIFFC